MKSYNPMNFFLKKRMEKEKAEAERLENLNLSKLKAKEQIKKSLKAYPVSRSSTSTSRTSEPDNTAAYVATYVAASSYSGYDSSSYSSCDSSSSSSCD